MADLFRHPELLEESPATTDSTGIKEESKRLTDSIGRWISGSKSSVVMYIGRFGSGKSTVLSVVQQQNEVNPKYEWITFEIWRYADRQQAWDGFVIEVAKKLGKPNSAQTSSFIDDIDDERRSYVEKLIESHKLWILCFILPVWVALSWLFWTFFNDSPNTVGVFIESTLKYASGPLLAILAFLGLTTFLPKRRPAIKRVFQLQELLFDTFRNLERPLVIVIEDVDRTEGNEGRVFMETLRTYLKNDTKASFPIVVIAPMSSAAFDAAYDDDVFQSALKVYDYVFYHALDVMTPAEISSYIGKLRIRNAHRITLEKTIISTCESFSDQLSMRMLKFILRELNEFIKAFPSANPLIAFILILSKYVTITTPGAQSEKLSRSFRDGNQGLVGPVGNNRTVGFKLLWDYGNLSNQSQINSSNVGTFKISYNALQGVESSISLSSGMHHVANIVLDGKYLSII